jgi:2-polyprenyl-6-hydroxyphenyl methylase/3-demethylubiquinone-9 3-methyltransferase
MAQGDIGMRVREFYEAYWQKDYAPPQGDPTSAERMVHLEAALRSFLPNHRPGPRHVLDVGCGDGTFLAFLRKRGFQVSGLELAEGAAARARRRCPDADVRVGSLEERLPFDDGKYDAVWCTDVLDHIFDVHGALAELNRVLKRDGLLVATTPYHGRLKNVLIALAAFESHYNPGLSRVRFFTQRSLDRCLLRAGFAPVARRGLGGVWPLWRSLFVVARKAGAPGPPPEIVG